MAEDNVERGFARLEGLIQLLREEQRAMGADVDRRIHHVSSAVATLTDQLEVLRRRVETGDELAREARETAIGAMRKASDSRHEIENVGVAIGAHIQRLEEARLRDASDAERRRAEAAKGHALRFEEQGRAIAQLAATFDRGVRVRPGQVAIITCAIGAIVVAIQVAGDVSKAWINAQYPAAPAVRER
jgi:hypothetical protein